MLLATPTLAENATLTAGSEASDMPATNLQKMQPSSLWRATDLGNSYLVVDLGEFQPINVLALLYTNASSGATVQVRGADTEAELTSSPGYDSGSVDHWPVHGMETWAYTHFLHFPSTAQTYRWWRFDISDANNPDGFYEAGRLYIDNAFEPDRGVRYGFNVRYKDGQVRGRALGNQIYPQQRNVGRILSGQIRWHSEADFWEEFSKLERLRGTAKDVLFVTDKTITARLMDWSAMGLFTDLEPLTHPTYGLYEANFNIEELLGVPLNVSALDSEISIADNSAAENAGSITFTITRATNTQGACSVEASTADGTATAGNDYTAKTETISFADGETTKNFTVTLLDDATYEGNETFTVNLTKPIDCVITDSSATGTINEDESAPVVSVDSTTYSVDEDAGTVTVTVNLTGAHDVTATVDYNLNDGTALAGTDYTDDSGTLTWTAGDNTPKTVDITIADRTGGQGTRDFTFDLSNPSNCTIGDAQATITIDDVFHLSDAVAAYDLQDTGSLWQDTAGTTAAGVGDPLGRIDDQSGNGNHLLQGTTAAKPTLQNDGANNYAYLDGVDDVMSASVSVGHPLTVAAAIESIAGIFEFGQQGADGNEYFILAANGNLGHRGSGGAFNVTTTLSGIEIRRGRAPATDFMEYFLDGVSQGTNSGDVVTDPFSGGVILGGRAFGGSLSPAECNFYRGVVMDRDLTSGEAASLDQWLADGSGVSL